jgi:serine/threonine-protein kinase
MFVAVAREPGYTFLDFQELPAVVQPVRKDAGMVSESEKQAAQLAVSRFGADRTRVTAVLQSVLEAQAQGQPTNFLDILVTEKLLTTAQANDLRKALDITQFDPTSPAWSGKATNGRGNGNPTKRETPASPARTKDPENLATPTPSAGADLRSLGEYRILRLLGEGGMGSVYLGYHETEKRQVAIKVLNEQLSGFQASVDRFYREAKSGALLDHPNIVRNITRGQDSSTCRHYLVLEYVDGPSAHALLNQYGRLSVGDAVHIVLDIARALEHAHSRNIVHRDIKPDNILITTSGVAKLADLGLAKRTDEASHLTAARQGFGTPYYMPYEQAMNAKAVDGRSDIYALGATLYHLVAGEVPFPGATHLEVVEKKGLGFYAPASAHNPLIPEILDRVLEKMLAREPRDRYQTASELIVDLERSNLAAAVPSFVDADQALQDPVVRSRLTRPAQPTAPDLDKSLRKQQAANDDGNSDLWYLRYRDTKGQWCKARATTRQVLQRLREGRMPREVEASHHPQEKFQPLTAVPEFREALGAPAKRKTAGKAGRKQPRGQKRMAPVETPKPGIFSRLPWVWMAALGLGMALGIGLVLCLIYLA